MSYINTIKNNFILLVFLFLISSSAIGQTQEEIKKITANYDLTKLKEKEIFYRKKSQSDKQKAVAIALQNNWPIRVEKPDGSISELMKISPLGFPIYYSTDNVNAARSTRVNHLNSGGSLGLNLNGQGMTARVWDGGNVRTSHNAFGGRVTVIDDPTSPGSIFHATHVTGTMVASAIPASVKGMASEATARTFNWTDDLAEVYAETQLGMLVSNHSYGIPIGSGTTLPSWFIGCYYTDSYQWDEVAYNAPYYLAVMSAGNEGENFANPEPIAFGYDKLTGEKGAKNNLTVANCQDVTIATNGTVIGTIDINPSSSQGPTDDFRIKPDITGNGTNLTSTGNSSDTATGQASGTSMASPNVAGSLLLLQQHYKNLTNNFMRAATLKGLACHTADDGGDIGPDPIFGWGLLNTKAAAEAINNNGLSSWISEENLNNNQTFTMTVNASGTAPLIASITWTDLPGAINTSAIPNDPLPALVNDLDIRITRSSSVFFPWKLTNNPAVPAIRTEDNFVDNVEQVKLDNPSAGSYTITIKHKGTLVTGSQKYSLVVTGVSSSFSINSTSDNLTVCSNQNAVYSFNYLQTGAGTTTFSAVDLPTGATATFSPATMSSNGVVTMTITNLGSVIPNEYLFGIKGTSATETETRYKSLRVYNGNFLPVTLDTPTNGQSGVSTATILKWNNQPNALNYKLQVSVSPSFLNLLVDAEVNGIQYTISGLAQATRYYWRVIPQNNCGTAIPDNAIVYSFATGNLVCDLTFTATDFSDAAISSVANSNASVPLTITGGHTIGDINVNIAITHTYVQDMTISLVGPASIGSPVIILLEEPCGDNQNINCTMDDNGVEPSCSGVPAISGSIAPVNPLSALNSLPADGIWTLRVNDGYNVDGGAITNFSINLCRVQNALSVVENPIMSSSVYPNPTKGIVNVAIPSLTDDSATIKLYDIQGRQILSRETNQVNTSFEIENLQDGIYMVNIGNEQGSITKKIILRRN
jgi:subtilisin-like proprotein convertase family protein